MSYVRSNVTNIRQVSFDLQVNQCIALLGIMAKPPGPSVASAMPSIPVRTSPRTTIHCFHDGPQRKSSDENSVKLRRQTIQVCMPGVSMSACLTFLDASHARNLRLISIKRSSVPHAIHNKCSCSVALGSTAGNSLSNSSVIPPELNAPIQPNLSKVFKPVSKDSEPPMERPAMARELRSLFTR